MAFPQPNQSTGDVMTALIWNGLVANLNLLKTRIDNAGELVLFPSTTLAASGAVNNQGLGAPNRAYQWTALSDFICSGFSVAGISDGQTITIYNSSASNVAYFLHNQLSATGNRLFNVATSAATPIAPGGYAVWRYDGTFYRLIAHEQGAWITPAGLGSAVANTAPFTGGGAMTWLVEAGDVSTSRWRLDGRTVTYQYALNTTTTAGTANVALNIANGAWGGFTLSNAGMQTNGVGNAFDGANSGAYCQGVSGGTSLAVMKWPSGNWALAANLVYLQGEIMLEVL